MITHKLKSRVAILNMNPQLRLQAHTSVNVHIGQQGAHVGSSNEGSKKSYKHNVFNRQSPIKPCQKVWWKTSIHPQARTNHYFRFLGFRGTVCQILR